MEFEEGENTIETDLIVILLFVIARKLEITPEELAEAMYENKKNAEYIDRFRNHLFLKGTEKELSNLKNE